METWFAFHHIVWAVKYHRAAIRPEMEDVLYRLVKARGEALGATVYAVNGTANHVHVVACLPGSINLPAWINQLKLGTMRVLEREFPEYPLMWEDRHTRRGFTRENLDIVLDYVQRQKEYHASGQIYSDMEPGMPDPDPDDDPDAGLEWGDLEDWELEGGDEADQGDASDWDDSDLSEPF